MTGDWYERFLAELARLLDSNDQDEVVLLEPDGVQLVTADEVRAEYRRTAAANAAAAVNQRA